MNLRTDPEKSEGVRTRRDPLLATPLHVCVMWCVAGAHVTLRDACRRLGTRRSLTAARQRILLHPHQRVLPSPVLSCEFCSFFCRVSSAHSFVVCSFLSFVLWVLPIFLSCEFFSFVLRVLPALILCVFPSLLLSCEFFILFFCLMSYFFFFFCLASSFILWLVSYFGSSFVLWVSLFFCLLSSFCSSFVLSVLQSFVLWVRLFLLSCEYISSFVLWVVFILPLPRWLILISNICAQ